MRQYLQQSRFKIDARQFGELSRLVKDTLVRASAAAARAVREACVRVQRGQTTADPIPEQLEAAPTRRPTITAVAADAAAPSRRGTVAAEDGPAMTMIISPPEQVRRRAPGPA